MMGSFRALSVTGAVLAIGLVVSPESQAQSRGQTRASQNNPQAPRNVVNAVVARERFVNRLLGEEDRIIVRNTQLLTQRSMFSQRLDFLTSQVPTDPRQARILGLQIRHTTQTLAMIQFRLNRSADHIVATVPGISNAITSALTQLSAVAPFSPQVASFVETASARQINNETAIEQILSEIPPSP